MKKKTLSIVLSIVMLMSMLVPFNAFAGIKNDELRNQVVQDMKDEVTYLNFTPSLDKAVSSQMLFRFDDSKKDSFLAEVKTNLTQNNGKLIVNGNEDVTVYAAVLNIFDILGEDYTDFYGYNIEALLTNCSNTTVSNPYYVMQVAEACKTIGNDTLAKSYIDKLIADTYTMGSGMNYWGYSADNNGMFLATVGLYKDDYSDYVNDAVALIEAKKTPTGYDSGFSISASTTACVLLGYTIIGDEEKATEAYKMLQDNFESTQNNGVFTYENEEDSYATSQVFRSLTYYVDMFEEPVVEPDNKDDKKTDDKKTDDTSSKSQTKKDDTTKSPQTGASVLGFAAIGMGAAFVAAAKKKED